MSSQPGKKNDLNGSAPDQHPCALVLVDVMNTFEFPGGEELLQRARAIAGPIHDLKQRARRANVPVIYANDNFGRWQSSFEQLVEQCRRSGAASREFVERLVPTKEDYTVLKPKHSAFYQTPLDVLLKHLGTRRLVLAGLSTNSCILFTAQDAYMRDLELCVPSDCVTAQTEEEHRAALEQMKLVTKARVTESAQVDWLAGDA